MQTAFRHLEACLLYLLVSSLLIFTLCHLFEQERPARAETKKITMSYDALMKQQVVIEGKAMYVEKCAACHSLRRHDFFFGRIAENKYDPVTLYAFIRNSDSVIQSGNAYYTALFEEWNRTPMTAFPELTNGEIDKIITYIKVVKTFEGLPKNQLSPISQIVCVE